MASQLQRIKELITAYEEFLEGQPEEDSIAAFLNQSGGKEVDVNMGSLGRDNAMDYLRSQNRQSLRVKRALKPLVQVSPFSSLDDYYLLLEIQENPSMLKKELIGLVGLEYSTGVEVILRLKKRSIVKESLAPGDKRARIVQLTAKGSSAVLAFTAEFEKIASDLISSLR